MAAHKPILPEDVKRHIVVALAAFDTPSQVAQSVKEEFGLEVSRQAVEGHDPTKRAGRKLALKWRTLFEESRRAFIEDMSAIAISHRATRLRALNRMATKAETMGNMSLAAQLHKQAAEEMGNAYTNKREHSGPNGGPIQHELHADLDAMDPDRARELIAKYLG